MPGVRVQEKADQQTDLLRRLGRHPRALRQVLRAQAAGPERRAPGPRDRVRGSAALRAGRRAKHGQARGQGHRGRRHHRADEVDREHQVCGREAEEHARGDRSRPRPAGERSGKQRKRRRRSSADGANL